MRVLSTCLSAALFAPTAFAATVTLNFDELAVDTVLQQQYGAQGVRFELIGGPPPGPKTGLYTAGVSDPGGLGLGGNLLILGESGGSAISDMTITFQRQVSHVSLLVLDAEATEPFTVTASGGVGAAAFSVPAIVTPTTASVAGPVYKIEAIAPSGGPGISKLVLDVTNGLGSGTGGPEAVDILSFDPVPYTTQASFANFTSTSGLSLNGAAAGVGGALRLNEAPNSTGTAFVSSPVVLGQDGSFSTSFTFRMSNPSGTSDIDGPGGDGIGFLMQREGPNALPITFPIGYGNEGRSNSMTVKFDTFFNGSTSPAFNDISGNFAGVELGGSADSAAQADFPIRLNDGDIFTAWIDYNPAGTGLEVRLSKGEKPAVALFTYDFDLLGELGGRDVYVGLGALSGSAVGTHEVLSWEFAAPVVEPGTLALLSGVVVPLLSLASRRRSALGTKAVLAAHSQCN